MRTLDDDRWVIGDKLILSRGPNPNGCSWSDGAGSYYCVTETSEVIQSGKAHCNFPVVHEAGKNSRHIIWNIGDAFLKLVIPHSPQVTREHDTLNAIKDMLPENCDTPSVLFHGEWDGRYYLAMSKVPGITLHEAWPRMNEDLKSKCVRNVTDLCFALAKFHGKEISGVDGGHLPELYLLKSHQAGNFAPSILATNSREIGMECSTLCFYHCDLVPGNILVNLETETFGIIDWECAGFVPREWIKTKFCVSGSMDLDTSASDYKDAEYRKEWKSRMQASLMEIGFLDVATSFFEWND